MSCTRDLRRWRQGSLVVNKREILAYRGDAISQFFLQFFNLKELELLLFYSNSYVKGRRQGVHLLRKNQRFENSKQRLKNRSCFAIIYFENLR